MKDYCNTLPTRSAIIYVCTKTADWQKYESFIVQKLAQDHHFEIIADYRDFEGHGLSSNRQGFVQMMKDIAEDLVPSLILVSNCDCLPDDPEALGIDLEFLGKNVEIVEVGSLGRKR